ncbi:MAG: hypothetical protein P1U78_09130 [Alcanivoracaceae bacterium]|nr:hypothetical protein [Alcanivoracaceae bacterium]
MIIRKYGIELRRLTSSDIYLLREMRNRTDIRSKMHAQQYITHDMQRSWFDSIDNMFNYFFLIIFHGRKVGLVQAKDVDFLSRTCEPGIYLWDENALAEGVSVKASVAFADALFNIILIKSGRAKVRVDNLVAHRHNLSLGYLDVGPAAPEFMHLDRERFLTLAPRLRRVCSRGMDLEPTTIADAEFPNIAKSLYLYKDLPDDVRAIFSGKIIALR